MSPRDPIELDLPAQGRVAEESRRRTFLAGTDADVREPIAASGRNESGGAEINSFFRVPQ
jgi:hypothetical protein